MRTLVEQGTSHQEIEVYNLIKMIIPDCKIIRNDRKVLNGKELDIYIPKYKLAVEFNGLFYHNSSKQPDPMYHLHKSIACERKGIQLIQIMSDEWEQRRDLCADLIKRALGKLEHLDAGKCEIVLMDNKEGKRFFEINHLQGNDKRSTSYVGLMFENNILFAASFYKGQRNWVLTRFANKKGYTVYNALDRVIEYFGRENKGILTASIDRRLYNPNELLEAGFKEEQPTNPKVFVTKDYKKRKEVNPNTKEFKLLESKGYVKIYDCGDRRFSLKI